MCECIALIERHRALEHLVGLLVVIGSITPEVSTTAQQAFIGS